MGHFVYKYVFNGEIIYIGKNDSRLEQRINQHKHEEKFKPYCNAKIYYIELANSTMSDVVESELIRRFKPKLNIAKMSEWSGLEFTEPEWKEFVPQSKNNQTRYTVTKNVLLGRKHMTLLAKQRKKEKIDNELKSCVLMAKFICPKLINMFKNKEYCETKEEYIFMMSVNPNKAHDIYYGMKPFALIHEDKHAYTGFNINGSITYNGSDMLEISFYKSSINEEFYGVPQNFISRLEYIIRYYNQQYDDFYNQYQQVESEYNVLNHEYNQLRRSIA